MPMLTVTKNQARQFILLKQGLLGDYRFIRKDGAYQFVRQAGCIQFDPVDVCGRNAELTLQSRVKGFRRKMLNDLLYRDRLLVDYSDKELSIWPVSSDTLPIEGTVFWHSSMHWSGHWEKESLAARSVLEQLYTDGILLIHHKTGSRKYYDLADKYFPADLLRAPNPCRDEEAFTDWRICRRIGAVGLLWNRNSTAWLGISMTTEQRNASFNRLETGWNFWLRLIPCSGTAN